MARVITFFPKQIYIGHGNASLVNLSEIFEITDENTIDLELRLLAIMPSASPGVTGTVVTTSDSSFVDAAWTTRGNFTLTGVGTQIVTGIGGLGKFVRATLQVPQSVYVCASMQAVAREL